MLSPSMILQMFKGGDPFGIIPAATSVVRMMVRGEVPDSIREGFLVPPPNGWRGEAHRGVAHIVEGGGGNTWDSTDHGNAGCGPNTIWSGMRCCSRSYGLDCHGQCMW